MEWVESLAHARASALVIELARNFREAPAPLVAAAERLELPLIVLHEEVRFVKVTFPSTWRCSAPVSSRT